MALCRSAARPTGTAPFDNEDAASNLPAYHPAFALLIALYLQFYL